MSPRRVLLNIDLGEYPEREPEALYALAHVANIACGGHAGDADSMSRALSLCTKHGALAGAHPSYPDRANFGRTAMEMGSDALRSEVALQCERLADLATRAGVPVRYMKPHGALYHRANGDDALARAVVGGAIEALGYELWVLGPSEGALARACDEAGVVLLREAFADRGTDARGQLLPRGTPGALRTDPRECAEAALAYVSKGTVDTLCVHGDTDGAEFIARAVRAALDAY